MRPDVRAIRTMLDRALAGVDVEMADRRPASNRWSIGEIVEHLARTYMGTAKGLGLCVADGRLRATPLSWRARRLKLMVVTLGHVPGGIESPAPVRPKGWGFALARTRAHGGLDALSTAVDAAAERFGVTTLVLDHPVIGAFSARDWCRFHFVHTRHHARQIAERPAWSVFPKG